MTHTQTSKVILYLGPEAGTAGHRIGALRRLGHTVRVIDAEKLLPPSSWALQKWIWEVGPGVFEKRIARGVLNAVGRDQFDIAIVDGGRLVGPSLAADLRKICGAVVNYNHDDPFGKRDRNNWKLYLRAVPFYDLIVVVRDCNIAEARARGARDVLKVYRAADEVAHAPRTLAGDEHARWASEAVFVGTWMPERGPFVCELIDRGVPLTIYGGRWRKDREWSKIAPHWRGPNLDATEDYARAIQCSKVAIGMVSKGNRDDSTTRSFEVPMLGTLLCAERTKEHQGLYRENEEALFWSSAVECAEQCLGALKDDARRHMIAEKGRIRCIANGTTNERLMDRILKAVREPVAL